MNETTLSPGLPNMLNSTNNNKKSILLPTMYDLQDFSESPAFWRGEAVFHKLLRCRGVAERALGWESVNLSSRSGFATSELSDLMQVISRLLVPMSSSVKCRGRGDLKEMISLRHKTTSFSIRSSDWWQLIT